MGWAILFIVVFASSLLVIVVFTIIELNAGNLLNGMEQVSYLYSK